MKTNTRQFLALAASQNLLTDEDTSAAVFDFRVFSAKLNEIKNAFPKDWKHAVAIKSNPLIQVLSAATNTGFGLEAASFEELVVGAEANPPFLVWDSPAKTHHEVLQSETLHCPIIINANSLDELKSLCGEKGIHQTIGLRINPEFHLSSIASMSVGSSRSKFGEPISNAQAIHDFYSLYPGKLGIHVHASSQNLKVQETVDAIGKTYDLAEKIGFGKLAYFDIGGGFPVQYTNEQVPEISEFSKELKLRCPKLFASEICVYTEFGRFYHANSGFVVSRIEESKRFENSQTIVHHLGANMFLRESYEPGKWPHNLWIVDKHFALKSSTITTDVGGPLCFGGDYLAKEVNLPPAEKGDYLIIEDTGANSIALWSMHCSRVMPKIIGINEKGEAFVLKQRQSIASIVDFWK